LIGAADFMSGPIPKSILILSGASIYQISAITAFNPVTGEITVGTAFTSQIVAGTVYRPLNAVSAPCHGTTVPKLYIGDLTISANTTDNNDVIITGNLVVNAGFTYTVNGDLQVAGNVTSAGSLIVNGDLRGNVVTSSGVTGIIYAYGNLDCYDFVINNATAEIDVDGGNLTSALGIDDVGILIVHGDIKTGDLIDITGTMTVDGNVECGDHLDNHTNDLTITGNVTVRFSLTNRNGAFLYIYGNLDVYEDFNNIAGGDVEIWGDIHISGYFSTGDTPRVRMRGNVFLGGEGGSYFRNLGTGTCEIFGNLFISNDNIVPPGNERLLNNSTGVINIYGELHIDGTILNHSTGTISISGNAYVSEEIQNDAAGGTITFLSKLQCTGDITNVGTLTCLSLECGGTVTNTGAVFTVLGDCQITGAIANAGAGAVSVSGHTKVGSIINSAGGDVTFNSGLDCDGGFDNTGGDAIGITGDVFISGTLTLTGTSAVLIYGNVQIAGNLANGSSGGFTVYGNVEIGVGITNSNTGVMTIDGNVNVNGAWNNTGGGNVTITGTVLIAGTLTLDGADTWTSGDLHCGAITNSSIGAFTVNGNLQVDGDVARNGNGSTYIKGNLFASNFTGTGAGWITISGDAIIRDTWSVDASTPHVFGSLKANTLSNSGSSALTVGVDIICATTLTNSSTGLLTVGRNISAGLNIIGNGTGGFTICNNVQVCGAWNNLGGGNIFIYGTTLITGGLTMDGGDTFSSGDLHCWSIQNSSTGAFTVNGSMIVDGNLTKSGAGSVTTIDGNVQVGGNWNNTGGGNVTISGTAFIGDTFTINGAATWTSGNLHCRAIAHTSTGAFTIKGNLDVSGNSSQTAGSSWSIYGNMVVGATLTVNSGGASLSVTGNIICQIFTIGNLTGLYVTDIWCGSATTNGSLSIKGNVHVGATWQHSAGTVNIGGDLLVGTSVTSVSGGNFVIQGNVQVGGNWNNTGGGNIIVYGTAFIGGTLTMDGGDTWTSGNATLGNLSNGSSGDFNVFGNLIITGQTGAVIKSGSGGVFVTGDLFCGTAWNNTGGGYFDIRGNALIAYTLTMNGADTWTSGDLHCGAITSSSTGAFTVNGNLTVDGIAAFSGVAIAVSINGNSVINTLNNSNTGTITFNGDLEIITLTNSNAGGTVLVVGMARIFGVITNAGTLTYKGVHPETAVTFNATNVAADVFHLAAASGFHHIVDKVRIKCADPGAQTVAINLLELINGVLTQVDSFTITTANFTTYFSLMDMFGIDHLAGDELQITALASDAGPYAVTGSYAYRSA
jgi:hypothetical protein